MSELLQLLKSQEFDSSIVSELIEDQDEEILNKALETLASKKTQTEEDLDIFQEIITLKDTKNGYLSILQKALSRKHKPYIDVISNQIQFEESFDDLTESKSMKAYLITKINEQKCNPFILSLKMMDTIPDKEIALIL